MMKKLVHRMNLPVDLAGWIRHRDRMIWIRQRRSTLSYRRGLIRCRLSDNKLVGRRSGDTRAGLEAELVCIDIEYERICIELVSMRIDKPIVYRYGFGV